MPSSNGSVPTFDGFSSPNYTQVPDELFDELMPQLSDPELRVLLYIIRRTFGFKRDSDNISLKQLVDGITKRDGTVQDRGAGLSKASAARGIKGLVEKGVVIATRNRSAERGNEPTTYRLRFRNDPLSQFETSPLSQAETPLVSNRDTQETVIQETDEEISKFERSHDEQHFCDAGESGERAQIAPEGPATPSDASASPPGPPMPSLAVLPPTGPENAPDGPLREELGSPDFHAARAAIRATLADQRRQAEAGGRRARRAEGRPTSPPASADPARPTAADAPPPRQRGRPVGSSAERELVGAFLADFNAELLHDDAALPALITQAIHIFQVGAIPLEQWPEYLYQARTLVKERAGAITTVSRRDGDRKNRGPYYFAVLRDLVAAAAGAERAGA